MAKRSSEHWLLANLGARDALVVIAFLAVNGVSVTEAREQAIYCPRRKQNDLTRVSFSQARGREATMTGKNFRKMR
jgi:hypothetical protein